MAKVKTNPIIEQIRGKVGDLVFKRYGDSVILARVPDTENREVTPAQAATRERFRQAALYGKMVMADPAAKVIYEDAAAAKGKPVFSLTVADFCNAPSVDEVDLSGYTGKVGDLIHVRTHDDFDVVGLSVAIADTGGQQIETGAAVETPGKSGRWILYRNATSESGHDGADSGNRQRSPRWQGRSQTGKSVVKQCYPD